MLQRELAEGWSLGGELFHQGAPAWEEPASSSWNIGLEAALARHLHLVASAGRVFQGERGSQYYLGLRGSLSSICGVWLDPREVPRGGPDKEACVGRCGFIVQAR